MPKTKYKFNHESLSFDRVELTGKQKIKRFLTYFLALILASAILITILSNFFELPKESSLRRENTQLLTKYDLLNKQLTEIEDVLGDIQDRDDNIYRVVFESEPISASVREAGTGGANKYKDLQYYESLNKRHSEGILSNKYKALQDLKRFIQITESHNRNDQTMQLMNLLTIYQ